MQDLSFHPLANIFPLIEGEAFDRLVEDVRAYGLNDPIILHEGMILDGRNRYRACVAAGVEMRTTRFVGTDPVAYVVSKNMHRRHLNESQRAMVAKRLATLQNGYNRYSKIGASIEAPTQERAAKLLNVSRSAVQRAGIVQERAAPELAQAVERGEIPVSTAAHLVELPKARQREIAAAGKSAAAKAAHRVRAHKPTTRHDPARTPPPVRETEHDRDLRFLIETWQATCESAHAAFLNHIGFQLKVVA